MRRAVLAVSSLLFLLGAQAPSQCTGSSEDFILEPEGDESLTAEAVEAWPTTVFVAGSLAAEGAGSAGGAALVAFDSRTHAERWRFTRDDPTREDAFVAVGAAAGRICGAGTTEDLAAEETSLIVACVHAVTGEPLWQKELPLPGVDVFEVSLDLSGQTLGLVVSVLLEPIPAIVILEVLALSFDPRDGGPGDDPDAFALEPEDGARYGFLATGEVAGGTAFVATSLAGADPGQEQAVLLAFDGHTRSERWRFRRGDPGVASRFLAVDSSHGRVCAAGWIETDASVPNPTHEILVACLRRQSGELLWQRQIPFGPLPLFVSLDLSARTLALRVLSLPGFRDPLEPPVALSFDARDGTGGGPSGEPPFLEPEGDADFRSQALEARTARVLVAGELSGPGEAPRDAALVAFDVGTLAERWRYRGDASPLLGRFTHVDASEGRVCAAGTLETEDRARSHLLVACFREHTGALLWKREVVGPEEGVAVAELDLSGRTLGVLLRILDSSPLPVPLPGLAPDPNDVIIIGPIEKPPNPPRFLSGTQVLAFDAHDGDGAGPPGFPAPPGFGD